MSQKKHTPLPWYQGENYVIMGGDSQAVAYASKEDGEIIVSAVNNTYGKEIKPEDQKCLNCKHWRDKAWTDKGWGICDNPKNETKISLRGMITNYMRDNPAPEKDQMIEELVLEVENGIRYPEDFGCILFEALEGS